MIAFTVQPYSCHGFRVHSEYFGVRFLYLVVRVRVLPCVVDSPSYHTFSSFDEVVRQNMDDNMPDGCLPGNLRFVMYHYIREFNAELPFLRFLNFSDFKKQLDLFQQHYAFPSQSQLVAYINGDTQALSQTRPNMVLTFDDGLADHYNYVLPELKRRGLWGIFYVPTAPAQHGIILDVHKVHLLLGRYEGSVVLREAEEILRSMKAEIKEERIAEFRDFTYKTQTNDAATTKFKRLMNYFLTPECREKVLTNLMNLFFPGGSEELGRVWYMNTDQLRTMHECGMLLGAHTVTHPVLSTLTLEAQRLEVVKSLDFVADLQASIHTGGKSLQIRTFCFPYGTSVAYNNDTLSILEETCEFTLDVDPQDCTVEIVSRRRQSLPR